MSENDESDFWLENGLAWFRHITPQAVEAALEGFELETDKDYRTLTAEVRRAFFRTVGTENDIDEHPGQLAVKREIEAIADGLAAAKELFAGRSGWAESVFRRYSKYDDLDDFSDTEKPDDGELDALDRLDAEKEGWWVESSKEIAKSSADWKRFREMACGMIELEDYMRDAAEALCGRNDPPRWRDSEKKKLRLSFANELALVFEETFERDATFNSWADENGQPRMGAWPDFFSRIARLALQKEKIPNLEKLLKEARRVRKDDLAAKADGIHNRFDLEFAKERLAHASKRLNRAGVEMIRRFATK